MVARILHVLVRQRLHGLLLQVLEVLILLMEAGGQHRVLLLPQGMGHLALALLLPRGTEPSLQHNHLLRVFLVLVLALEAIVLNKILSIK